MNLNNVCTIISYYCPLQCTLINGLHMSYKDNAVIWFCFLHNRPDNYLKGIINISVVPSNTFALSLLVNINISIVQYACIFLLNNALKGFNDSQQSKFKLVARWIVVKVSDLNNASCLKNYIVLLSTLICS